VNDAVPVTRALTVRGPYRGMSGHDHHVREFVRHLVRAGIRLQLIDVPEWGPVKLPDALRESWFDTLTAPVESPLMLHFCMPHQVTATSGHRHVNYTMFEASRVPRAWVEVGFQCDRVVVPTDCARLAWLESGLPEARLRVCPLGIDPTCFHPGASPLPLEDRRGRPFSDYTVRVLNVSDITPRKNLLGLLRVWIQATRAADDALLVVKIGRGRPGAALALMRDLVFVERALGKTRAEAAPMFFLDRVLADADMPRLFAAATHYWSMSHGEGWDQPMVEAAATGLRLIAPRHTAYLSYLDDRVATLLPCRPVPALIDDDPGLRRLFEGTLWWEPDDTAAADAVRRAIAGADVAVDGHAARDRVAQLTWSASTDRLLAILAEVAETADRPDDQA
jgi:glycosyltransferase involved in cell wall biosynthesis